MQHVRLLILLSLAGPAARAEVGPLVLTDLAGAYAPGSLPAGGGWLALECGPAGCALRSTRLQLSRKTVLHLDEFRVPLEIPRVKGSPLALLHGLALSPGPVTRWHGGERDADRATAQLRRLGRWTVPGDAQQLALSWVRLPEQGGFRYHLGDGTTRQFLFATAFEGHYGGDTTPRVRWAGDLDGDGRADLLLSLPDDNCGFDNRLYLSSMAGPGQLVGLAARFAGRYPACGC
jgi:hypothetical protein